MKKEKVNTILNENIENKLNEIHLHNRDYGIIWQNIILSLVSIICAAVVIIACFKDVPDGSLIVELVAMLISLAVGTKWMRLKEQNCHFNFLQKKLELDVVERSSKK